MDIHAISVDLRSKTSACEQIFSQIQGKIELQQIKPGEQLPPVRSLARQLAVNFNTVARAYRMLDQSGLISTQQGRGTFVNEIETSPKPDKVLARKDIFYQHLQSFIQAQAEQLEVSQDEIREWLDALGKTTPEDACSTVEKRTANPLRKIKRKMRIRPKAQTRRRTPKKHNLLERARRRKAIAR